MKISVSQRDLSQACESRKVSLFYKTPYFLLFLAFTYLILILIMLLLKN